MFLQTHPYNEGVVIGRPPSKEAPLFGQRLAAVRRSKGLSQRELAERLGVSRQTVNALERGKYDPSLPLAFKIARLFDRRIEDIFEPGD